MNSRERVKRAVHFEQPDQAPISHAVLPAAQLKYGEALNEILAEYREDFPFGSPAEVKEEVQRVFEACGTPDGGIIACGEVAPEVPLENIRAMYEAFREYGT